MGRIHGRYSIALPTIVNNHLFNSPVRSSAFVQKITRIIASFSYIERIAFFLFVWIFAIGSLVLLWNINKAFLIEIPADGGSLTEGIIGAPRFINPLLAISDADRDLTILTYSGLLRATALGTLVPDLAQEYSISDDGLTYTFVLRDNIFFHDGTPITADDVVFTVTKAQDSVLKSPKRANWDGVVVEKESDKVVIFRLKQAYAPFLENTTLGILPKHIWEKADPEQFSFSQFNITPVGSGPYTVDNIERDSSGIPASYDLRAFKKYAQGKPYITELHIRFYANEEELTNAFKEGEIESINAISPKTAEALKEKGYRIERSSLPRIFGVFFNQNQASLFTDLTVRKALSVAVDKERIIDEVLSGYGTPIDSPIPPGSIGYTAPDSRKTLAEVEAESSPETPGRVAEARAILERNGWTFNEEKGVMEKKTKTGTTELAFALSTSDVPELKETGELVKKQWEAIGARVDLKVFGTGDLNQNVIRPRKYDALLFGEIVGRDSDLFSFWHSSQRNDPGLNVALYANITADKLLEEARTISDTDERIKKYQEFKKEIARDIPAVFIYAPDFIYVLPEKIQGITVGPVKTPSERFLNIPLWFIETDHIWKFFVK